MKSKILLLCCLFSSFSACSVSRITSTEYTAVEQALISSASKKAVCSFDLPEVDGKKVFLKSIKSQTEILKPTIEGAPPHYVDSKYIEALVEKKLLLHGARLAEDATKADIIINLLIDYAAIDDSNFILGLPSVPLPIPGVASIQTPEISIFSKHGQYARAGLTLVGVDSSSRSLSFKLISKPVESHYSRWNLLLLLGWRTTDLSAPF